MNKQQYERRRICTAITHRGNPCRAWAVPGTDPPRCASHGGVPGRPGAPVGNQNAVKHGLYAKGWNRHRKLAESEMKNYLDESLAGLKLVEMDEYESGQIISLVTRILLDKFIALSDLIDQQAVELPLAVTAHLLGLQTQMAARLGRLLRDKNIIHPEENWIDVALNKAMEELSVIHNTDLTRPGSEFGKTFKPVPVASLDSQDG